MTKLIIRSYGTGSFILEGTQYKNA